MDPIILITDRPNRQALTDYADRREQTITFVVVGILLMVAASVGIGLTIDAPRFFPLIFGGALLIGTGIALRPACFDWTPYHDHQKMKRQLDQGFKVYEDNRSFLAFASKFNPNKLTQFGWISNLTATHYHEQCQLSIGQNGEAVSAYRGRWNDYVSHPNNHRPSCDRCRTFGDPEQ